MVGLGVFFGSERWSRGMDPSIWYDEYYCSSGNSSDGFRIFSCTFSVLVRNGNLVRYSIFAFRLDSMISYVSIYTVQLLFDELHLPI